RTLEPKIVHAFLLGDATLDTLGLSDPANPGRRRSGRIPPALRPAALWVLQFRRRLFQTLERTRLRAVNIAVAATIEHMQRPLITKKYRYMHFKPDGSRRAHMPPDMVAGPPFQFEPTDTLICIGSSWTHLNIAAINATKHQVGFRFVVLCYDIIPL